MTNKLQMAALAATLSIPLAASAGEQSNRPEIVPIGNAVLKVVEIGVAPSTSDRADEAPETLKANPQS